MRTVDAAGNGGDDTTLVALPPRVAGLAMKPATIAALLPVVDEAVAALARRCSHTLKMTRFEALRKRGFKISQAVSE